MQVAIDSFYVALRDRLATLSPARTVTLNGETQPAILLAETQPVSNGQLISECFYLSFGAVGEAKGFGAADQPLFTVECTVTYETAGVAQDASDRGRALRVLDAELMQICAPPLTERTDYTKVPAVTLGTNVTWLRPKLGEVEEVEGKQRRTGQMALFYFSEVNV